MSVLVPSSEFGPPTPSPQVIVSPPLDLKGGGQHSLAGEGVGEPNSDDGKESLALCILCGGGGGGGMAKSYDGEKAWSFIIHTLPALCLATN